MNSDLRHIENRIFTFRDQQVMIDSDLAELYQVETKRLNEQVKRNKLRFPKSFLFQLTDNELAELVANCDRFEKLKHSSSNPYAFTEQGVAMLSAVLRSDIAIQVSIQIMNAFITMRKQLSSNQLILQRIDRVELKQLDSDQKFEQIFKALESKDNIPKQGIFFDGQVFDAHQFVSDLIRKAKRSIILIDNYMDDSVLTLSKIISDGFLLKREDRSKKDLFIHLIDYEDFTRNNFKIVNQLEIQGFEKRIPDGILYINGLPLVVIEFKSSIRENSTLHNAFKQLTTRYKRDIPELFKYNAFCIISDGVNNKAGSFFAPYEFFYAWRKIEGLDQEIDPKTGLSSKVHGINSMYTMVRGMLDKHRLCDIIHHFIYLPDSSKKDEKILCRYPQYYAATKLFENIKLHQHPHGDGKGGTYFGATGCGKSFTMLFLTRLLMKSADFASPTIVLITDRTDLDDQLSGQFTNAKGFVGDNVILSAGSRAELRNQLKGRNNGGVFLTTIHKFNEDTELLTERSNVICISDEAHRSQVNLDQKVRITADGVKKSFGFAKHLHDSLPNATYVGFTGTPIDATMDVFGEIVDTYTMTESVMDDITVRIVYEGRAAKVLLENQKLQAIENYYRMVAEDGGNEYQIDESKRQMAQMGTILGDPGRIRAIAKYPPEQVRL